MLFRRLLWSKKIKIFIRKMPHIATEINKTGTSQVGTISRAQKYSRNNYWNHLEKLFSSKKVYGKKCRTMPKNPKRGHLEPLNVFYKLKTSKNARGYPLIKFENFQKKSHSVEKNPNGAPFGLSCTFGSIKKIWFSARIEPTLSGLVEENLSKLNK